MTSFRKIVFPVCIVLFLFCDVGLSQNLAPIRAALARGGRSVCPYCWACAHEWNCDRPCRPSYRDYCALCAYRFHCRSTCVNLCPFPETTRSTTTTITTTAPTTTTPTTTTETTTLTTPASTTPGPCTPNPCALGGACLENTDGTFNCTCPPNLSPCDGDWRCTGQQGTCQSDSGSCPGGYRSELCSGPASRRCCLPEDDLRCTNIEGTCQSNSITCPGGYRTRLCSGDASRRCCMPAVTSTTAMSSTSSGITMTSPSTPPPTTPQTSTPASSPCQPNPCPTGGVCVVNQDGSFNCTCPPNQPQCDAWRLLLFACLTITVFFIVAVTSVFGDWRCRKVRGTCQSDGITCAGVYRSGLCSGADNRRCCLPTSGPCVTSSEMSQLQAKLIQYEGIRYTAYDAQPRNSYVDWTICVGFNLKRSGARSVFSSVLPGVSFNSVYAGRTSLSRNQCFRLFEHDLSATYIPRGNRVAGNQFCSFPTNVKIAIVNAVYRGDLGYSHQTARYIRAGNWCPVAAEYLNYQQYIQCHQLGIPGVCSRMDWNAAQFRSMCRRG